MPPTESARSALSSFTCTLCNKSYSRHPEYEAHIGSYDHQHRKRLQDLKQLSRDPNAAEKARRAERKADAEAGLRVIDTPTGNPTSSGTTTGRGGGGGGGAFKKGNFKSSFAAVKGPAAPVMKKKNVLGDDDDEEEKTPAVTKVQSKSTAPKSTLGDELRDDVESDTDEEYGRDTAGGGYYDPRHPTDCFSGCTGLRDIKSTT
ncbi:hypothetical protein N7478_012057 [Penicillium angulare]|uniref:uncharacterized protein n=1 Tax=Penicillium angulare TaxID=116970 RepID=UPI002542219A|nr:uncharacterized protein N7478_012057 [Penicillium angulare]KAJ5261462.1 hypothetical protein N7478_012057 [Penicillium angulare]